MDVYSKHEYENVQVHAARPGIHGLGRRARFRRAGRIAVGHVEIGGGLADPVRPAQRSKLHPWPLAVIDHDQRDAGATVADDQDVAEADCIAPLDQV